MFIVLNSLTLHGGEYELSNERGVLGGYFAPAIDMFYDPLYCNFTYGGAGLYVGHRKGITLGGLECGVGAMTRPTLEGVELWEGYARFGLALALFPIDIQDDLKLGVEAMLEGYFQFRAPEGSPSGHPFAFSISILPEWRFDKTTLYTGLRYRHGDDPTSLTGANVFLVVRYLWDI